MKKILKLANIHVSSCSTQRRLVAKHLETKDTLDLILSRNGVDPEVSRAQLQQDIIALALSGFKHGGYFVEFGATNGVELSNTYLLEKNFRWNGILAEPMTRWHADLKQNRQCTIDERCVWTKTGEKLKFLEVEYGELSTIASYADSDLHSEARKQSNHITVDTVSLADLLMQHNAPNVIDYLSVDTEGSELDILSVFPFSDYKFNFISVEHNYTENREKIKMLLHKNGYKNVLPGLSKWDDWFVPQG